MKEDSRAVSGQAGSDEEDIRLTSRSVPCPWPKPGHGD